MATTKVLLRGGWRYEKTIGGSAEGSYQMPTDVALRPDGMMAVLNRGSALGQKIVLNTYDEERIGEFGELGEEPGQLVRPSCVAFDRDGLVYVADEHTNRVTVFTIDPDKVAANGGPPVILRQGMEVVQAGKYVSHWGVEGRGDGELNGPASMVFDDEDNVYLTDSRNNRVQKFTKDGRFLGKWGSHGTGDGEFDLPWGITIDPEGSVFVADWRNDRIQKFTPDGEFLASYGSSGTEFGQFNRPTSVAVDKDGDIYVSDWLNDRVQIIGTDGRFVNVLYGDSTLSKWVLESLARPVGVGMVKMHFLSEDTYQERYFRRPISLKFDAEAGRLLVVDNQRFRVQVYQKVAYPSSSKTMLAGPLSSPSPLPSTPQCDTYLPACTTSIPRRNITGGPPLEATSSGSMVKTVTRFVCSSAT